MSHNWIGYYDTCFAYYLGITDTSHLNDYEWCEKIKQLEDIRKREAK